MVRESNSIKPVITKWFFFFLMTKVSAFTERIRLTKSSDSLLTEASGVIQALWSWLLRHPSLCFKHPSPSDSGGVPNIHLPPPRWGGGGDNCPSPQDWGEVGIYSRSKSILIFKLFESLSLRGNGSLDILIKREFGNISRFTVHVIKHFLSSAEGLWFRLHKRLWNVLKQSPAARPGWG